MATLRELRDARLEKLQKLKELGVNPYPAKSFKNINNNEIHSRFDELEGKEVIVAGRVQSIREHGKLTFIDLKDHTNNIQLYIKSDTLKTADHGMSELNFSELPLLDLGDFVEARGVVLRTKRGEVSVETTNIRLLTKSLRPIPEELTDKEVRLRRRYLDLNVNQEVYERFVRRSKFWQATREFLLEEGFLELNIPVLESTAGGADANPFVTHMDALDQDFYLRISHELPLKRLLGGGYPKVFDIGPRFRNEGYSDEHLPEHVAMEWYWAYANWEQGMEFTQRFVRFIADKTWGRRKFTLTSGVHIDLGANGTDWPRLSFVGLIKERFGIDPLNCTLEEVQKALSEHKIKIEKHDNLARGIDKLWKKIRVDLSGPAFLVDVPTFLQPLAKLQQEDNRLTEQFNLILGGTEACKAYSELNDPLDQYNRFLEQEALRGAGDAEAQMMDIDFVEMLEYGMPPACGYGHSERLFWMLEGVTAREGVIFPQLRHEVDNVTKGIYPEVYGEMNTKEVENAPGGLSDTLEVSVVTNVTENKIVIGKILDITQHPNADKLVICKVHVGKAQPQGMLSNDHLQIVTGAKNIKVGDIIPVALHGATIPGRTDDKGKLLVIKKGNLRGERSEGMLCSRSELKAGGDADGIWILDTDTYRDSIGEVFVWEMSSSL